MNSTISFSRYYLLFIFVNYFTFVNQIVAQKQTSKAQTLNGKWRATLQTSTGELPFFIEIKSGNANKFNAWILNGTERLPMDESYIVNDSLHIPMKLFDAEIITSFSANKMTGIYKKQRADKSFLITEFTAQKGINQRFAIKSKPTNSSITGRYKMVFASQGAQLPAFNEGNTQANIFELKQAGTLLTGTILTPTGDYRFLEGVVDSDSLKLSCYDGSHIYLFLGKKIGNSLSGTFTSNVNQIKIWKAELAPNAVLPAATALTYLKPGFEKLAFQFPNEQNQAYSFPNESLRGKVKIIQILGSWCPNCMDETNYLSPWYDKNQNRGVEIIALAFEKSNVFAEASPKMAWMKKRFKMNYQVLFAGDNGKANMLNALPQLNSIVGFPTTIIIDKNDKVRHIHTGFSGPATGQHYLDWQKEFNEMVDKLLAE